MSTIMRSDQTLRLVQLYHEHHSEMSRHTHDIEGRRRKMEIWRFITDDLNTKFDTQFSVEQYKKKLQNVQCTSRQKLQTGKRPSENSNHKFSPAEKEFIRLFESGSSNGNSSSPNSSNSLLSNLKVEDLIQHFGSIVSDDGESLKSAVDDGTSPPPGGTGMPSSSDLLNLLAFGPMLTSAQLLPALSTGMTTDRTHSSPEPQPQASPAATSSSSSDFGHQKASDEVVEPSGAAKRKKRRYDPGLMVQEKRYEAVGHPDVELQFELLKVQNQILAKQIEILAELRKQKNTTKQVSVESEIAGVLSAKLDRLCECLVGISTHLQHISPTTTTPEIRATNSGKSSPSMDTLS